VNEQATADRLMDGADRPRCGTDSSAAVTENRDVAVAGGAPEINDSDVADRPGAATAGGVTTGVSTGKAPSKSLKTFVAFGKVDRLAGKPCPLSSSDTAARL
jgi:hypothetical protein